MAKLYVIGTPIGNLEDITFRAIETLKMVDTVVCEDTRTTKILLDHYNLSKKTLSFNSHASDNKIEQIIDILKDGKDIALVTDAGTPSISDPGSLLVKMVMEKIPESVKVITIPGPSALVSALSISGLACSEFTFLGFLPHKKGRETLFKEIVNSKRVMVFYESPHRILKTLKSLSEFLIDENSKRKVVIARELTKIYEEVFSGSALEVLSYFENNSEKVRGEFVVMVEGM